MTKRCEECHLQPAVVALQQGERVRHLCAGCAAAAEGGPVAGVAPVTLAMICGADGSAVCPGCGATVGSLRASGRLGCGECWTVFASLLRPLLVRLHGADRHAGRGHTEPVGDTGVEEIGTLEAVLASAVAAEAFEEAAAIRDAIRALRDRDDS